MQEQTCKASDPSNMTLEREVQRLKHSLEMGSTDDVAQIDFSAEHS
jgi:hypothetical protein